MDLRGLDDARGVGGESDRRERGIDDCARRTGGWQVEPDRHGLFRKRLSIACPGRDDVR